jgi:hypothetical protein
MEPLKVLSKIGLAPGISCGLGLFGGGEKCGAALASWARFVKTNISPRRERLK